ncbi:MAG: transcriptional regulator [Alphaproteobacteria bacterium]|nr:transcriptional regulator [Alphaproteobacteria bacterium]
MKPVGHYHYTESGLDNVWLLNGFRYSEGPDGLEVSIEDLDGLHRAIGENLITRVRRLSGKVVRFLRQEMSLSQVTMARLFGVSERAVARWERAAAGGVPGPAESALRMLYRDFIDGEAGSMRRMLKAIADMEGQLERVTFSKPSRAKWQPAESA